MQRRFALFLGAAVALAPLGASAQTAPPVPATGPMTPSPAAPSMLPAPTSTAPATYAPATSAPSAPSATSAPPTAAPSNGGGNGDNGQKSNRGKHLGQIKKLQSGSLSLSDLRYALTHPGEEATKARRVKNVSFDKLRVYRLSAGLKSMLKISSAEVTEIRVLADLSPSIEVAQANGSNSPIAVLQNVLANINVSNALNNVNVLNGANVNVGVSLADVLNGNKISIGSVLGVFVNSLGIITTITK